MQPLENKSSQSLLAFFKKFIFKSPHPPSPFWEGELTPNCLMTLHDLVFLYKPNGWGYLPSFLREHGYAVYHYHGPISRLTSKSFHLFAAGPDVHNVFPAIHLKKHRPPHPPSNWFAQPPDAEHAKPLFDSFYHNKGTLNLLRTDAELFSNRDIENQRQAILSFINSLALMDYMGPE